MKPRDKILHPEALLDAAEVCAILGMSRKTLYNYTHIYKKRPIMLSSIRYRGKPMFRRQTIDAFIAGREIKGIYKRRNNLKLHLGSRSKHRKFKDRELGSTS